MAGITKSYRLTADGAQVKREFGEVGRAGEQMERKIRDGAKAMHPALRAVDAAARELKGSVEGAAGQAGGFGNVLRSMGPAGLVAAAGVGALVMGFSQLNTASRAATDTLGEMYTASHRLNVSVEFLQEWRYAMVQTGEDARVVDATLGRFAVKLGQLTTSPAMELRQKLRAFGFSEDDIAGLRTVEEALPIIADRIRELGTAAEDASLLEALGLKEMQLLLSQGSEAIERTRQAARELGIVIDEDTLRRAHELGGAWDAAAYALDIKLKEALIDAAPLFIELTTAIAGAVGEIGLFIDRFATLEDQSSRFMSNRLGELGRAQGALYDQYGATVTQGGNALNGRMANMRGGALGLDALTSHLSLSHARDRYAFILSEIETLSNEFASRAEDSGHGSGGSITPVTAPGAPDPRIAQVEALIERLREEARVREDLLQLQQRFPGSTDQENQARLQLLDTLRDLEDARREGHIASDAELESLQDLATASYNAAAATRAAADAQREMNALLQQVQSFRESVRTPEERLSQQEQELRDLYDRSQGTDDPITSGEFERGLRRIREEYEKLAEAQFEASLEGRVLRGVIDGQIRSVEDLQRVLLEMAADAFTRELMSGGLRREGGVGGFFGRVLDRFSNSVTGGDGGFGGLFGGGRDDGGAKALGDAAAQAAEKLAGVLTPSVAEQAVELGISTAATVTETTAKGGATASLVVLTKAAQSAAAALASVGSEEGTDVVTSIVGAFTKGPGRAGGGSLFTGQRHPFAEGGQAELLLLGGSGHVLPHDTLQGIVSLARLARGAGQTQAGSSGSPRVSVALRDASGAGLAVEDASATMGADGGVDIDLLLGRQVANQLASGRADRAMKARYGLKSPRIRRG